VSLFIGTKRTTKEGGIKQMASFDHLLVGALLRRRNIAGEGS